MSREPDRELVRRAWILRRKGYTQEQIGDEIGRASRTVQNYHREEWLAARGLLYIKDIPAPGRSPVMPLQEEAFDKCQIGDHSWMKDRRFDGVAYSTRSEREYQTDWKRVTNGAVGTKWQSKVCYFCTFDSVEPRWSGAVYVGEVPA